MEGYLTKAEAENDDTEELPVLSEEAVLELEARRGDSRSSEADALAASNESNTDRDLSLLERIASLESYIAGRADRWRRMEQDLETRSRRIAELETELAQRIARERHLEERLHEEGDSSNALRRRLRMLNRQLETGNYEHRDRDPDPTREMSTGDLRERLNLSALLTRSETEGAPSLVCTSSRMQERYVMDEDPITIGRAPGCDIRIMTDLVSRQHARIVRKDTATIIQDCSSTNGVFVNSQRVPSKALDDGDEITIGKTHFVFQAGDPRA